MRARVAAGDFSPAQGERLIATNYVNDYECGTRLGMTWFVFSVDLEEGQHGVEEFFRLWGGESLYRAHHEDEEVQALLRSVGTPCIVEATLPSEPFTEWPSFGERLYEAYLGRRDATADGGWEGAAKEPVRAEQIRRVIQLGDPLFESLTGCSRWESPLI